MSDLAYHLPPAPRRRRYARLTPPGYTSVAALAEDGYVSRSTIYAAVKDRRLPASMFRGRIVIDEAAAKSWLQIQPLPDSIPAGLVSAPQRHKEQKR